MEVVLICLKVEGKGKDDRVKEMEGVYIYGLFFFLYDKNIK